MNNPKEGWDLHDVAEYVYVHAKLMGPDFFERQLKEAYDAGRSDERAKRVCQCPTCVQKHLVENARAHYEERARSTDGEGL